MSTLNGISSIICWLSHHAARRKAVLSLFMMNWYVLKCSYGHLCWFFTLDFLLLGRTIKKHSLPTTCSISNNFLCMASRSQIPSVWLGKWRFTFVEWGGRFYICFLSSPRNCYNDSTVEPSWRETC